ncbi:MAG: protein kinase [Gemmatimonadales bacterium]
MASTDAIAAGAPIGRYEIVSLLSAGGMGELYRARDPELGRDLVLKLLPRRGVFHPDALDRFVREARAASALNHPNIVTVYEIGESPAGHFIAMELISGRTLREIRAESPSIQTVAKIGAQAARALAVAHAAGIIHRDIKPENLMLRDDGYLKVLDFGIAQLSERSESASGNDSRITQPGMVVGTMRYMSPEQAQGHQVTPTTDVFSLGIVLYELAAGRHPFESSSDMAVLSAIILRDAQPPSRVNSRVPEVFDSLVMRMMAKDPADRPGAAEVDDILDGIVAIQSAGRHSTVAVASPAGVIGREVELQAISEAFEAAKGGTAGMICVSGEPGIGKTTLTEAFLRGLTGVHPHSVALGRCSERLAGAEAYLPLLDALDDLMHDDRGGEMMAGLRALAPTWSLMLSNMATSAGDSSSDSSPAQSQERMKRELAAFLEMACTRQTLILLIEDIHWADASTVDVLGYAFTRLRESRFLVVITYRPAELQLAQHPFLALKLDLQTRGAAREIPLSFFTEEYVERFIADRFPVNHFPAEFAKLVHSRTEGSPLFVEDLLRYLKARGAITKTADGWEISSSLPRVEHDIPESMRSMVERKISQLDAGDRNLLAAASVQGYSFDSAIVARALRDDTAEVEDRLEALDRVHGFVRRAGEREFASGEISGRYRFVHVLYQNALYASLSVSRRVALSKAVGESLLSMNGNAPSGAAAELGFLFETARETERAAAYFGIAAEAALNVFAFDEASRLAHRGIALLSRQTPTPQLRGLELGLQLILGSAAAVMGGYAAAEAMTAMDRARVLAEELGSVPQLSPALWGLHAYFLVRGEIQKSLQIAQQALTIATEHKGEMALVTAHTDMAISLRFTGKLDDAVKHFERAAAVYNPVKQRDYLAAYHMDPGVFSLSEMTRALWALGQVDRSLQVKEQALTLARSSADPRTVAFALLLTCVLHHLLREPEQMLKYAEEGIAISDEHQIIQERAWITTARGYALAALGRIDDGIDEISASLAMRQRMNATLDLPYALAQLAEAYAMRGDLSRARATLVEALEVAKHNDDVWFESEIYRQLGDIALISDDDSQTAYGIPAAADIPDDSRERVTVAEAYYQRAVDLSRSQGAKSLELRAATSLSKLLQSTGRPADALSVLAGIREELRGQRETFDSRAADEVLASLRVGEGDAKAKALQQQI